LECSDLTKATSTLEIPYYNHKDIIVYKVIIRFHQFEKKEKFYIQKNTKSGDPILTVFIGERSLAVVEVTPNFAMSYDGADLSYLEEIIVQMDEKVI